MIGNQNYILTQLKVKELKHNKAPEVDNLSKELLNDKDV